MNKIILFFSLLIFGTLSQAAIPKNITQKYIDGKLNVSYAEALWAADVGSIKLYSCNSESSCSLSQSIQPTVSKTIVISTPGLWRVEFYSLIKKNYFGSVIDAKIIWNQMFINFEKSTKEIEDAAIKYKPVFSFHKREEYFPVSIDFLFNRPISDGEKFAVLNVESPDKKYKDETLKTLMVANGNSNNKFRLKKDVAKLMSGNKNGFPIYWFSESNSNKTVITYFVLYAYDLKRAEYIFGTEGYHSLDRESISIEFQKIDNVLKPTSVIYAGHLPTQPVTFAGCSTLPSCSAPGVNISTWTGGKTSVAWDNVSKTGNSPIAYIADGAHAVYPGFGYYKLNEPRIPFTDVDVLEPAGNSIGDALSHGNLVRLDLNNTDHSALTYSGFLIDGTIAKLAGEWYRIFPFVRYPINSWADGVNTIFSNCVKFNSGCEKYINSSKPIDCAKAGIIVCGGPGNDRDALILPNGGENWKNGEQREIRWMTNYIVGSSVDLYVLHDNPTDLLDKNNPDIGIIINSKNWYKFATNLGNSGSYMINPAIMSGTGNAYMVLVVSTSDRSKFDLSDGRFSLNYTGSTF